MLFVGWLDWSTGWELSLFVFYAVPILLVVWYGNLFSAILFALASSGVWWLANEDQHPYATGWGYLWASLSRMTYFLFVAVGGRALRVKRNAERGRLRALERASELERQIVRISEEEQQRIGRDLHDGICQYLAGIKCALGIVRHDLETKGIPQHTELRNIESLLKDAVTKTRDLARGISPVMNNEAGLAAALQDLCGTSACMYTAKVRFQSGGDVNEHDPQKALHLYRIAQEALGNALRHSGANTISITLDGDDQALELSVVDNGRGIQNATTRGNGMGLRTMEYRARSMNAEFSVAPLPQGGTSVRCRVPRFRTA
ncbi:sensor histidine kinase [Roseimicrobium gellanilyticum]|nr:sensor histidine kinase [Roseimicrobium gellanilyticum]